MSSSPPMIAGVASTARTGRKIAAGAGAGAAATTRTSAALQPPPPSPSRSDLAAALPVLGASLTVGAVVLISGVKSRPHLNGTMGVIYSEQYGKKIKLFLSIFVLMRFSRSSIPIVTLVAVHNMKLVRWFYVWRTACSDSGYSATDGSFISLIAFSRKRV